MEYARNRSFAVFTKAGHSLLLGASLWLAGCGAPALNNEQAPSAPPQAEASQRMNTLTDATIDQLLRQGPFDSAEVEMNGNRMEWTRSNAPLSREGKVLPFSESCQSLGSGCAWCQKGVKPYDAYRCCIQDHGCFTVTYYGSCGNVC